jgi:hypothetical protein
LSRIFVALPVSRLGNDDADFQLNLLDQAWALLAQGHEESWVAEAFTRAAEKMRQEPKEESVKKAETKNTVRLVTTFNPNINVNNAFNTLVFPDHLFKVK